MHATLNSRTGTSLDNGHTDVLGWGRGLKNSIRVTGISTAIFLAACSPYVYNQEIEAFNGGVNAIAASYDTGRKSVSDTIAQQQQQAFVARRVKLDLPDGCDQVDPTGSPPKLPGCAVVKFPATGSPAPTSVEIALASAAPAFDALKNYAGALSAVTNAADDAQLRSATQGLISSVDGLSAAVASVAPGASSPQSKINAAGSVLGQAVAFYLDSKRYEVLRNAVPAIDSSIATLGETVKAALLTIRAQQLLELQREMHAAAAPLQSPTVGKLSAAEYQNDLSVLQSKVAAFNQIRSVDPQATVAALVDAHHKLAQALQDDARQAQPVYATMIAFLNSAAQLQSAFASGPAAPKLAGAKP